MHPTYGRGQPASSGTLFFQQARQRVPFYPFPSLLVYYRVRDNYYFSVLKGAQNIFFQFYDPNIPLPILKIVKPLPSHPTSLQMHLWLTDTEPEPNGEGHEFRSNHFHPMTLQRQLCLTYMVLNPMERAMKSARHAGTLVLS